VKNQDPTIQKIYMKNQEYDRSYIGVTVSDIKDLTPVADLETSRSLGTHAYNANILSKC
jgi:hypothetical protein